MADEQEQDISTTQIFLFRLVDSKHFLPRSRLKKRKCHPRKKKKKKREMQEEEVERMPKETEK